MSNNYTEERNLEDAKKAVLEAAQKAHESLMVLKQNHPEIFAQIFET